MYRITIFILLLSFNGPVFAQDLLPVADLTSPQDQAAGDAEGLAASEQPAADVPIPANPLSVPGIVKTVTDSEKNKYAMLVVQPMKLTEDLKEGTRVKFVPVTESVENATGELEEVTKYTPETITESMKTVVSGSESPVIIPLKASTPCFRLSNGVTTKASASDLTPDTHVLVTGSLDDAMEVAEFLRRLTINQVILTGTKPRLPEYIVALSSSAKAEQTETLAELLQKSSPYRGKVKFFGELKLEVQQPGNKLGNRAQFPLPMFPVQ